MTQIHGISLDERTVIARLPHIEAERAQAIQDLLVQNHFLLKSRPMASHFSLHLKVAEQRLQMTIIENGPHAPLEIIIPLKPFKAVIKDYFLICESYFDAVQSGNHPRVEAIDMGRRGIHNEGAELLKTYLEKEVEVDNDTARRLFTLICVLHI